MEKLKSSIEPLVKAEVERARQAHGEHNSPHESYAYLSEEIEELQEELHSLKIGNLRLWKAIRKDKPTGELQELLLTLRKFAINAAAEAIQVVCVIDRFIEMLGREKHHGSTEPEK